jgi:hypothetical protein
MVATSLAEGTSRNDQQALLVATLESRMVTFGMRSRVERFTTHTVHNGVRVDWFSKKHPNA